MKRFNILHFLTMLMVMTLTISSCSKDEEAEDKTETGTESGKGKEEELTLSSISLDNIKMNQNYTIQITSGSGSYSVESSDTEVVSVEINGKTLVFYTHKAGTATITVTDKESGQSVSFDVTVEDGTETGTGIHTDTTPKGLEAVDLGLPSGTLWANMNVGATKPKEPGGYYAWGEAEEKGRYDEFSYLYYKDGEYIDIDYDIAGTEYDVAHVKWGGSWRMPSLEQIQELLSNCTSKWRTVTGVYGREFTGPNGGKVFLPAAGIRWIDRLVDPGFYGTYWSSTQSPDGNDHACYLFIGPGDAFWSDYDCRSGYRHYGRSVRPVLASHTAPLILSASSVKVEAGQACSVEITSGSGSYTAESNATAVATVTVEESKVIIHGVNGGNAIITVTDNKTCKNAKIEVVVEAYVQTPVALEAIDLGLPSGTKWANMNVGASKPEDYGDYYAWGETNEKADYTWVTYKFWTDKDGDGNADEREYQVLGDIAGTEYDVAHVKWGGSWRMPSFEQIQELLHYCTSKWTHVNSVYGREFAGPNGGKVFLPAAGYRRHDDLKGKSNYGLYWSSTPLYSYSYSSSARGLYFTSNSAYDGLSVNYEGLNVRPVSR